MPARRVPVITSCVVCSKEFSYRSSNKALYCSDACNAQACRKRNPAKLQELNKRRSKAKTIWSNAWYHRNKDNPKRRMLVNKANRAWRKRNLDKCAALAMKHHAAKKQAIPKWVDWNLVNDMYAEARYQQLVVDHIIPLQSHTVCGLHWEGNLQLLSDRENKRKSNRYCQDTDIVAVVKST